MTATPPLERILSRTIIDPETGCWRWPGMTNRNGYARIKVGSRTDGGRRNAVVHRIVYEELVGPIVDELDHVWEAGCRYKDCHNPDHLEDVTRSENMRRIWALRKATA
jgi:hypothetical protein